MVLNGKCQSQDTLASVEMIINKLDGESIHAEEAMEHYANEQEYLEEVKNEIVLNDPLIGIEIKAWLLYIKRKKLEAM